MKIPAKLRLRNKLATKQGSKKICLTMIVKNEAKNMNRILDSVKTIVDMISIVDTGSTDNTIETIHEWGRMNDMRTAVHSEPFKNFAHNRTHSVRAAKEAFPDADFFLLSDADFVWENNKRGIFDKVLLIDHKYLIEQYNKSITYWNIRLLSAKVDWECVGSTHEYWTECPIQSSFKGQVRTSKITTIMIDDREDGGCKSDKFERDQRLLHEGLEDENTPKHLKTRYKFYLAQTLKDMGMNEESMHWYRERIKDGGWTEEMYYSKFQMGYNYEQMGWKIRNAINFRSKQDRNPNEIEFINKWAPDSSSTEELEARVESMFNDAETNYLAAYKYRKTRVEALMYLVRMCRMLSRHEKAYRYVKDAIGIKFPSEDTLFVEKACYEWMCDFELSIIAFYVPTAKDEGRQAIARLLTVKDLPKDVLEATESNSRHYL